MKKALFLAAIAFSMALPSPSRSQEERVTEIRIFKAAHRLELVSEGRVVKTFKVAIGPGGDGPKRMEGDKVTPVGTYRVNTHIKGLYRHFLGVSYPNDEDRARYAESKRKGEIPRGVGIGHSIGIHGVGSPEWKGVHKQSDWTLGCIALDDDEIDEVARRAKDGTKVVISD
jgi:murein L,D-transpeptidase YafK